MTLLISILINLLFTNANSMSTSIKEYLQKNLSEYNKIEYSIISPKNVDVSECVIDDSREFKVQKEYAYLPVILNNNSDKKLNGLLTLKLKLYKNVLVAKRDIRKKEILNLYDFRTVEKEVSKLRFEPTVPNNINSLRARFKISSNSIVMNNMIEQIPDIQTGDRIEAIFSNNIVNISFAVTARTEGIVGDIIKIKRDDKKIFKAKIISNNTVKIIE